MKVIKHPFGNGQNSDCYLISLNNELYVIKMTDSKEPLLMNKYLPKRISVNNKIFNNLSTSNHDYIYQYEYIDGYLLTKITINDKIFEELIKLINYFFRNGYLIWDCQINNFVVTKNNKIYFVDFGGITKINNKLNHYVFDIKPDDFPEEFNDPNYPLSLDTEAFTIFWIAYQLKNKCNLKLSPFNQEKLDKMLKNKIKDRFQKFENILD